MYAKIISLHCYYEKITILKVSNYLKQQFICVRTYTNTQVVYGVANFKVNNKLCCSLYNGAYKMVLYLTLNKKSIIRHYLQLHVVLKLFIIVILFLHLLGLPSLPWLRGLCGFVTRRALLMVL